MKPPFIAVGHKDIILPLVPCPRAEMPLWHAGKGHSEQIITT